MVTPSQTLETQSSGNESFATLLEESFGGRSSLEGGVVKGIVVSIEKDMALIDVGLKSEGRVAVKEFAAPGQASEIKVGDIVEVYIERIEDKNGEAVLSREKAVREASWIQLEQSFKATLKVTGVIFNRVKGGFSVDLGGATAFLPGSQVDIRPIRDVSALMGVAQPFVILKMDRARGNIVVSRRVVLEESRAEARTDLVSGLVEGQVLTGVVKNITDYGAFVDLGGVDGLLHVTDISWKRVNHPTEVIAIGQTVKVVVIRFNRENQRISLGMKQLESDPWQEAEKRFTVGTRMKGRITNITDYGAFVELGDGIEGLVHVSEMSWTKKNIHPGKIVSTSQEVEIMVLDVDPAKRRISLGLKQCTENPWAKFAEKHGVNDEFEGEIRNITEFGLFVGLNEEIDGMVHLTDLSWIEAAESALAQYKKGDRIRVKLLDIDPEKERISLGVKQLTEDPLENKMVDIKKGKVVTCIITEITDGGVAVNIEPQHVSGFIKKSELARERSEQNPHSFGVGEKVDAKVVSIDRTTRQVQLSIKAREVEEDKQAMEEYGSSDSGASLGDILGAAMSKAKQKGTKASEDSEETE